MPDPVSTAAAAAAPAPVAGQPFVVDIGFAIEARILFAVDLVLEVLDQNDLRLSAHFAHLDGCAANWLPRGNYRWRWSGPEAGLPAGARKLRATLLYRDGPEPGSQLLAEIPCEDWPSGEGWRQARLLLDGDPDPQKLSWRRGHEDWFFRHFDHAAPTVGSYFLKDSPLLRGRILDVGCGDGITDLGLYLRYRPQRLVGIDPFRGYQRLPELASAEGIGLDPWPEGLEFLDADANHLPFADDSFDVVVSWGSLEHIAGGYGQALREIKRVLRPDGLFFVHPGLYYSNLGHHLGEFSEEPFFHLKYPQEALRELVLSTPPRYIDRAGEFASNQQYWQWYTELNPITVSGFERELRALDFEPWRVALRTEPIIEYTQEILHHPMQDLSTCELYMSCWNRKKARPEGFVLRED